MISFLLSAASIEPKMIITIVLGAVCAVLLILLIVEHLRRKNADDRAAVAALDAKLAKADAERAKAAAETARANAGGALHTVKEEAPTELEYDPRLDPSPMGVVSKSDAPIDDDIPEIIENKKPDNGLENRLTVEEEPVWATAKRSPRIEITEQPDEEPTNDNVYSEDKLLIDERNVDDADVVIIPYRNKKRKSKLLKNKKNLVDSFFVEESYDSILPERQNEDIAEGAEEISETPVAEVAETSEMPVAEVAENTEDAPRAFDALTDTLRGIASAFASVADTSKPSESSALVTDAAPEAEKTAREEQNSDDKKTTAKPEAKNAAELKTSSGKIVTVPAHEQIAKLAAKYADPDDMFERFPYKKPLNIVENVHAFTPDLTVPASLEVKAAERKGGTPPMYVNVGGGNSDARSYTTLKTDGKVGVNVFLNSDIEKELKEKPKEKSVSFKKEDCYEVEAAGEGKNAFDAVKAESAPAPEYEVSDSKSSPMENYTVEDSVPIDVIVDSDENNGKAENPNFFEK